MTLPKGDQNLQKLLERWEAAPKGEEKRRARNAVCIMCQEQGLKDCEGNCQIAAEDEADDEFAQKYQNGFFSRTIVIINGKGQYVPREGE